MRRKRMRGPRGLSLLLAVILAAAALAGGLSEPRRTHAQESAALAYFTPVTGRLDANTPALDYTLEANAGQVIALLAVRASGDLDPLLQVYGPDGALVAENDDLDSLVRDAGLEALTLPDAGRYTVRVARYGGAEGTTAGEFTLTLTPGFARVAWQATFGEGAAAWVTPEGEAQPLAGGGLRLRTIAPGSMLRVFPPDAAPVQNFYLQTDARLFGTMPYAELGLVLRAQGPGRVRAYVVRINSQAQWSVELYDGTGVFVLRSWTANEALRGTGWTLGVLARDDRFDFFANGVLIGTVRDNRLPDAGAVGLMVMAPADQAEPVTVTFDNVALLTRLGTTYVGLPLALTTWNAPDPATVMEELAASGQVRPGIARDYFLPEKSLEAADQTAVFELLGSEAALYEDFVLGAWVSVVTTGPSPGCGLVYRWQDEANLDLAFVDRTGGFGIVQARDGDLTRNVYAYSPMVGVDGSRLLLIAQGERVALYVNGVLVSEEQVKPGRGRFGVALLNYETARTACYWSDVWVWPLED